MSLTDYRPRLSTELTLESYKELSRILPHGWQKPLFQALVDGVITLYGKGGIPAIGAIISGHIELKAIAQDSINDTHLQLTKRLLALKRRDQRDGNNLTP